MSSFCVQGVQVDPQLLSTDRVPGAQSYSGKQRRGGQALDTTKISCYLSFCILQEKLLLFTLDQFSERPPIPEENQAYFAHLDSDRLHLMQMKRLEMTGGMEEYFVIQSLL